MRTRLTELLGIDLPLVAFSHCRDVVAAVTNAGGFGVLGAVAYSPARLDQELSWIDAQVRGRPYGVDVLVPGRIDPAAADPAARLADAVPDAHRDFVAYLFRKYGVGRPDFVPYAGPADAAGGSWAGPVSSGPVFSHPVSGGPGPGGGSLQRGRQGSSTWPCGTRSA
jgi:hypothetical protein